VSVSAIRELLEAQAMPPLRMVKLIGSMPAGRSQAAGVPQSPAAFVTLLGEDAQPNRYGTGAHAQTVARRFGVLLAVRDVSDADGGKAVETLDSVRAAVMSKLVGQQPEGFEDTIEFRRGSLVDVSNGVSWWLDEFGTSRELQGE